MLKATHVRAALCFLLGLALVPWMRDEGRSQTKPLTEITVILPNPSAINVFPMWTAIGEGYFEKEGLKVNVEAVDGSSQVLQAMSAGQAQIGLPGPGPVLGARARGVDVVFIYNLNPISIFGIVVPAASPYRMPVDLKGKVIGVGTADGAEVTFSRTILSDAGMNEGKDYRFLPVGDGGPAAAAFLRKDIEAYAAAASDAAILQHRGIALREITPDKYKTYFGNGFAALRSYIDKNPDVIERFGRAIVRGTVFARNPANKDKVLDHCKKGNPQEGEDRNFASALFEAIKARGTPLDQSNGWGYQPPDHWKTWHDSQVASGALKQALPDLTAVYTNQFVKTWNEAAQ